MKLTLLCVELTYTLSDHGSSNICMGLGYHLPKSNLLLSSMLSAVTPCLESVPVSQGGRDSTVMRPVLLDSTGKFANRSAAAKMGLTVTV